MSEATVQVFQQHNIQGASLVDLTRDTLQQLGVQAIGDVDVILGSLAGQAAETQRGNNKIITAELTTQASSPTYRVPGLARLSSPKYRSLTNSTRLATATDSEDEPAERCTLYNERVCKTLLQKQTQCHFFGGQKIMALIALTLSLTLAGAAAFAEFERHAEIQQIYEHHSFLAKLKVRLVLELHSHMFNSLETSCGRCRTISVPQI